MKKIETCDDCGANMSCLLTAAQVKQCHADQQRSARERAMRQPTPAPWRIRDSVYVENDCGRTVADCAMNDNDEVPLQRGIVNANNARLIAAAPDLLQALEDLRKELRQAVKFDVKKHYSLMVADVEADKAIQKARGER